MASRWGKKETVADFLFLGSKIIVDGDCIHEVKRHLFLGRKAMTKLDSIFKSRDVILPTKVWLVKAMVFPVVTCGCESWTIKKAEHQRINALYLCCWRRLLRVPWTARRSNHSIPKEISPECSLKGLYWSWNSNALATWCEKLTHWKRPWSWERLRVGEGDNRGWDGWMASLTQWTWAWASSWRQGRTGKPGVLQSIGSQEVLATTWCHVVYSVVKPAPLWRKDSTFPFTLTLASLQPVILFIFFYWQFYQNIIATAYILCIEFAIHWTWNSFLLTCVKYI